MEFVLLQSVMPWWVSAIGLVAGVILGLMGALPWRSAAEAAKSERDSMRDARNRAQEESAAKDIQIALLEKDKEILTAKTDLNGFRINVEKMFKQLNENVASSQAHILTEFESHAAKDLSTADQTLEALRALTEKIKS